VPFGTERAPAKTGREKRMKEPHRKDLASHSGPESCVGGGNSAGEALTGENTGREIELRNHYSGMPTLCSEGEGYTEGDNDGESPEDPAESKALRMCGHSLHGNRESQAAPRSFRVGQGRPQAIRLTCTLLGSRMAA